MISFTPGSKLLTFPPFFFRLQRSTLDSLDRPVYLYRARKLRNLQHVPRDL